MPVLTADLAVVGGGPAGAAAAITAARAGLDVVVIEGARFPRFRPGETLSVSTGELIERLIGVMAWAALPKLHYSSIRRTVLTGTYQPSDDGRDAGLHLHRSDLDAALISAARAAGARILQPASVRTANVEPGKSVLLRTTCGDVRCGFMIDATGATQWLSRSWRFGTLALSRPLHVQYQYCAEERMDATPEFVLDRDGWSWCTALPGAITLTARLSFGDQPLRMRTAGGIRHANCTWRISDQLASPHFALAGDAACHIDPASSRGVLRAIVSGISASNAAYAQLTHRAAEDQLMGYCHSMTRWFLEDCYTLDAAYRRASGHPDPVGFHHQCTELFSGESHDT